MLPRWARLTVTVTRPGVRESRGSKVPDWSSATKHEVTGCMLDAPSSSADYASAAQPITGRRTLYAPPWADIKRGDRITADGATWAVDGAPALYRSPFGTRDYLDVQLIDWEV